MFRASYGTGEAYCGDPRLHSVFGLGFFLGPPAEHVLASVVIQLFWHGVMMGVWHAWCFLLVGFLLFVRLIGWKGWRCVVSWIYGLRVVA